MNKPNYFLISVSNKENLELCEKYALAGFTSSINGLWTFCETDIGDYVSFLYAARARNLYKIVGKEAVKNAEQAGPWPSVTFRLSGKTYYFPFRLRLEPVRAFVEPLIRNEFAYVAENLLLRGGYRKTHFQADQTTLQNVSQFGETYKKGTSDLKLVYSTFTPKFTSKRNSVSKPEIFLFQEIILQSLIRQYLSCVENMRRFLESSGVDELEAEKLEVLGEKAVPEGHIDLLIKESVPIGLSRNIVVEVKLGKATEKDFEQLARYKAEFGDECLKGVIIAKDFSKKTLKAFSNISPIKYSLGDFGSEPRSFDELLKSLTLLPA